MNQPLSISAKELERWLDEFIAEQMEKLHVPGVTFSLVQNGELLLAKGFGYTDSEQQIPVVADRTIFCVGGNAKLFTATAIMQLVEKELINLDDDVNKYLQNFQIENNYPQPVTITNLLTHTAGFDNSSIGMVALSASDIIPLGEYLAEKMPKQVRAPGELIIGCNYSYGLLGYIVELVSGVPFNQYINENILQPLEMNHSSFELPSHLALSYRYRDKQKTYQALPFDYLQIPPTGSLCATATDMANFAIAHLQQGRFKSQRILAETTAQQMQQQQLTNDPRLPGMCLGFMEYSHNNSQQRAIGHQGGVVSGFRSRFYLLPSQNLGLFVAENASGNISHDLIEQFRARYFPADKNSFASQSGANPKNIKPYQGSYSSNTYTKHSLEKVLSLWSSPLYLKAEANGTLSIPESLKSPNPVYLQEIEPLTLQVINYPDNYLIAQDNNHGSITSLLTRMGVLKKLAWYETNTFHWILIWCFILVFLSGFIVNILALTRFPGNSWHQLAQLSAGVTCGLNLVCAFGMLILSPLTKNNYRLKLVYGVPKIITVLLFILLVTSVLALGLPVFAALAWINHEWSFIEQLHYSLVSLTALGLIPFLNYWNLLGFRY